MTTPTPPRQRFEGKVALVTGAGRGIGRATALELALGGARVALLARTETELREAAAEINDRARAEVALPILADVEDAMALERAFACARRALGPVSILVNNAGYVRSVPLMKMDLAEWHRVLTVNLTAAFVCTKLAFEQMREAGGGSIVNVSSLAGIRSAQKFSGFGAYSAAKHGVIGLTEVASLEGREHGIRVNCVAPGAVDTRMFRDLKLGMRTSTTPEDIAKVIADLCDATRSGALNGSIVEVWSNA